MTKNNTLKFISLIPKDIKKIIFYYIPVEYYIKGETQLIKNVISIYNIDHDYDLTKMYKLYFMKSFMSFYVYVFNTLHYDNEHDGPIYGRKYYDTLELDDS